MTTLFRNSVVAVFLVLAVGGVAAFALFRGGGTDKTGAIVVWGTFDERTMNVLLRDFKGTYEGFGNIRYVGKEKRTFDSELVEALASGTGPDLLLLPQDAIVRQVSRVFVIPYSSYSERAFKDTFIEEGELYLTPYGILGIPFSVDPLVLYWNRDIFQSEGIAQPPQFWDEFFDLSKKLTTRDQSNNITRSAIALGEYRNITNAKEIVSVLAMQAGTPIIMRREGNVESVFDDRFNFAQPPAEAALQFFTEFSNPVKSTYSWHRALPESRQAFLAGDLAIYFGFASELAFLRAANPNLNFRVSELPQSRGGEKKITFGKMTAFAIPKASRNIAGALLAARALTDASFISPFVSAFYLPPVRRDLLISRPSDAYLSVFYDSALIANAWLEPDNRETDAIFQSMVESVTSGSARISDAVNTTEKKLENLLQGR